jgi:hypothetical protein
MMGRRVSVAICLLSFTVASAGLTVSSNAGWTASSSNPTHGCTGYEFALMTIIMLEKFCSVKVGMLDDDLTSSLKECSNSTKETEKEAIDVLNRMRSGNYDGLAFTEEFIKENFEGHQKAGEDLCAKFPASGRVSATLEPHDILNRNCIRLG